MVTIADKRCQFVINLAVVWLWPRCLRCIGGVLVGFNLTQTDCSDMLKLACDVQGIA